MKKNKELYIFLQDDDTQTYAVTGPIDGELCE